MGSWAGVGSRVTQNSKLERESAASATDYDNGSEHTATWNSQLGPKLESQYQAGNMNCGGQEKGTLPSQYCHKIMKLLFFRKITFLRQSYNFVIVMCPN